MKDRVQENGPSTECHLLLLAVHPRDTGRLAGEELRREVPERRDDARLDQLDLPPEMALTGLDLVGQWIAVSRRAAFENVDDIDVVARKPDVGEQLVEELACRTHERDALLVLVEARSLADEHQIGVRVARAEHDLRSPSGKCALGAAGNDLAEGAKLVDPRQLNDRSHSFRRHSRRHC